MSSGLLYENSNEPKEGFDKHEVTKDNVTKTSYRRYFRDGAFGYLKSVSEKEVALKNGAKMKQMRIVLADKDGNFLVINFPQRTPKNGLSDYSVSLCQYLPNLKEGYCYRVLPYAIQNEGSKYKNYGISFSYARLEPTLASDSENKIPKITITKMGKDEKTGASFVREQGEISPVEWVPGLDGNPTINTTKRDGELYGLFNKHIINPKFSMSQSSVASFDSTKEGVAIEPAIRRETPEMEPAIKREPQVQTPTTTPVATTPTPTAATPVVEYSVAAPNVGATNDDLPF